MECSSGLIVWFFFSSRRRHTRFDCDWSSDVCSSDLETQGGPGGHLVRQPGPEGVAQRFLPTRGKALRRNEIRVAVHRVRLRGGQRESWRRTVETGPKKILTIQRVVEAALALVQFGGERIAAVHLVRGAVDE